MLEEEFTRWFFQLQQLTQAKRWRSLVVLSGDESWTMQSLDAISSLLFSAKKSGKTTEKKALFYGDVAGINLSMPVISVNRKNYTQFLGTEQRLVVFSVNQSRPNTPQYAIEHSVNDFDVDAFAALSGTLVAGGIFLLLLPRSQFDQSNRRQSKDYFIQRFLRQLTDEHCYVIRQQHKLVLPELALLSGEVATINPTDNITSLSYGCATQEQALAVDAMLKVLSSHRNRPLVLTADRGRGKSTALAIAACQMLENAKQPLKIIITAASKQALKVFFQQVEKHLPNASMQATAVEHANGSIMFYPIDVILKEQPEASIVMVDEAAAIPVYLLQQLLSYYHRLIFSTTIHGYEGAGRGFSIKFQQVLQDLMPHWRKIHIHEPIRWASDDPLERLVFNSCLLNASLPLFDDKLLTINDSADAAINEQQATMSKSRLSVETISSEQLLQNEALLQQVFAVLVTAHYQTSPSDLQLLMNNSAISLLLLKHENDILGVVMLMREGHVDDKVVALVRNNQRRLRDQFLPQSLLMHCGIKESFNYSYQRVMRIAIHPQFQGQGLGRHFLNVTEQHVSVQGIDMFGASFAGNARLLKFWQQAGFSVARIGFSKDKASGEHSFLVTKALTPNARDLQPAIAQQFYQQFDYWLSDEFTYLSAKLVWQTLNGNTQLSTLALTSDILSSVNDFVAGERQFSSCVYALHRWLLKHCTEQFSPDVLPLIARILQKHSIAQVCQQYDLRGKKALTQHLISYIEKHQAK